MSIFDLRARRDRGESNSEAAITILSWPSPSYLEIQIACRTRRSGLEGLMKV